MPLVERVVRSRRRELRGLVFQTQEANGGRVLGDKKMLCATRMYDATHQARIAGLARWHGRC